MRETLRYQSYVEDESEEAPAPSRARSSFDSSLANDSDDLYAGGVTSSGEGSQPPQSPVEFDNKIAPGKRVKIRPPRPEAKAKRATTWDERNQQPPNFPRRALSRDRDIGQAHYGSGKLPPGVARKRSRSASRDRRDRPSRPVIIDNRRYAEASSDDEWYQSKRPSQRYSARGSPRVVINNRQYYDDEPPRSRPHGRQDSPKSSPRVIINNRLYYEDSPHEYVNSDHYSVYTSDDSAHPSYHGPNRHRIRRDRRAAEEELQRAKREAEILKIREELENLKENHRLEGRQELRKTTVDPLRATTRDAPISASQWQYESTPFTYPPGESETRTLVGEAPEDFTFEKVEKEGLSISLELRSNGVGPGAPKTKPIADPTRVEALAWKQPMTILSETASMCELLTIRALEYVADGDGSGRTTLVCPGGPMKESDSTSVQLRWLHVKRNTLAFGVLRSLILVCPYISQGLTGLALTLLEDVEKRFSKTSESGAYIEPGTVIRGVGKYKQLDKNDRREPELAYFLSSPHITLQKSAAKAGFKDGYGPRTLLQSLYGYDIEDGTSKQILQKITSGKTKELLHVNQIWYLLVGPDILITMSDMPLQQVQGKAVAVDKRSFDDGGLLSICLYDENSRRYNSVVDLDYTYVDLLRHCVSLVTGNPDCTLDYELLDPDNEVLTSAKWLRLVSSTTKLLTFYLRDKGTDLRPPSDVDNEIGKIRERGANDRSYSVQTREREVNIEQREYGHTSHTQARPSIPYAASASKSYPELSESRGRPIVVRRRSTFDSPPRYSSRSPSSDGNRLRFIRPGSSPSSPTMPSRYPPPLRPHGRDREETRGRTRVRSPSPPITLLEIEREDPSSVSSDSQPIGITSYDADSEEVFTKFPPHDHNTATGSLPDASPPGEAIIPATFQNEPVMTGRPTTSSTRQSEPVSSLIDLEKKEGLSTVAQDFTNTGFDLEEASKESAEAKNWPVVLYTGYPFSPPRAPSRGLNMIHTKSYKDTRLLQNEAAQTSEAPFLAPLRRRSTSLSSNGGGVVALYTRERFDTTRRARSRTKYTRQDLAPYYRGRDHRHGAYVFPRYRPERRISKQPSEYRRVYSPLNHTRHGDHRHAARSTRSEITRSLWPREYGDNTYPSRWDTRTVGSVSLRPRDRPSEPYDEYGLKWTDKVAMTENVTNDVPSQPGRNTEIYTLDNVSDTSGQTTDPNDETLDNDNTTGASLSEQSSMRSESPESLSHDHYPASESGISEAGKPEWKLPGTALRRTRRPSQSSNNNNNNRRTKNVQFADEHDQRYSPSRPVAQERWGEAITEHAPQQQFTERLPEKLADVAFVPFLEWPLKSETNQRDAETIEKNLIRILSSMNKKLQSGEVARLYSRSFRCTLQDLRKRHSFLFKDANLEAKNHLPSPGGAVLQEASSGRSPTHDDDKIASTDQAKPSKFMLDSFDDEEAAPGNSISQEMESSGLLEVMRRLHEVSQEILSSFIPKEGSPLSHHISVRFWGAVDAVFRQLEWEAAEAVAAYAGRKQFVIQNYEEATNGKKKKKLSTQRNHSWADCKSCRDASIYDTAIEALDHLHSHHDCSSMTGRPWDDPCSVWIRVIWDGAVQTSRSRKHVLAGAKTFIETLLCLNEQVIELHGLVANAWSVRMEWRKNKARPPLPASIVEAFTQIVMLYIMQAQDLSLENRIQSMIGESDTDPRIRHLYSKQAELVIRASDTNIKASNLLQDAKKDIILLGSTSRDIHGLGVEAVGPEFLVMFLITNMQNRKVMPETLVSSSKSSAADYIHVYRSYIARLRFQASKRPKRRLFLDIDALQEELVAAATVDQARLRLLDNYLKLLSPGSFRVTNKTRIGIFRTEKSLAHKQQRSLRSRIQDIQDLIDKADYLKVRVKQTIEIIEEDHGKAIRVFTIVTLFFLPLSFVSSFMGMNTVDIRDMSHGQSIFWSTSIPVTAVVLFAAVVYGYYGDEIGDWLAEKVRSSKMPVLGKKQPPSTFTTGRMANLTSRKTNDSLGF